VPPVSAAAKCHVYVDRVMSASLDKDLFGEHSDSVLAVVRLALLALVVERIHPSRLESHRERQNYVKRAKRAGVSHIFLPMWRHLYFYLLNFAIRRWGDRDTFIKRFGPGSSEDYVLHLLISGIDNLKGGCEILAGIDKALGSGGGRKLIEKSKSWLLRQGVGMLILREGGADHSYVEIVGATHPVFTLGQNLPLRFRFANAGWFVPVDARAFPLLGMHNKKNVKIASEGPTFSLGHHFGLESSVDLSKHIRACPAWATGGISLARAFESQKPW
jgi:hypothetical protein